MKYTFEQLPLAINTLHEKVDGIKELLLEKKENQNSSHTDLLTIGQAADFLKLSVPTLYSKVSHREVPVSKRGKRLYFSKADLMAWVKSGKRKTMDEIQNDVKTESVSEKLSTIKKTSGADQWLNARQAARLINYRRPTLYGLVRQNKIPYSKTAGKLLFSRNQLLEWLENGKPNSIST